MPNLNEFDKVSDLGKFSGFPNMLKKEIGFWIGKSKAGLLITLAAFILINALVGFALWVPLEPIAEAGLSLMIRTLNVLVMLSTIIVMLGSIIGENKMGTSEWVLSKPITREAFIFAKIIGNWIGLFVSVVIIQTLFALLHIFIATGSLPNLLYLSEGLLLLGIRLLFIISLMIFLPIVLNSRALVLGSLVFLMIIQSILAYYLGKVNDWLPEILPHNMDSIVKSISLGQSPDFEMWYLTTAFIIVLTAVLIYFSILIFKRREF